MSGIALALLLFGGMAARPETADGRGMPASATLQRPYVPTMQVGDVVPDGDLVDQLGRRLSLRRGTPSIVSFAYTRCNDGHACSLVTAKFSRLQGLLRTTGIRLVEVTLDPEHDRSPVLKGYADAVGADPAMWLFATGRTADVLDLSERFGILRTRGVRGIGHTEAVAIVSGNGALLTLIAGTAWSPEDIAAEVRLDGGLRSDPFRRLALRLFAGVSAACGDHAAGGFSTVGTIAIFCVGIVSLSFLMARLFGAALRQ